MGDYTLCAGEGSTIGGETINYFYAWGVDGAGNAAGTTQFAGDSGSVLASTSGTVLAERPTSIRQ